MKKRFFKQRKKICPRCGKVYSSVYLICADDNCYLKDMPRKSEAKK